MKLSDGFRQTLSEELRYVAAKMREDSSPEEKAYYFSAAQGMVYRILNLEYNHTLLFIHLVLTASQNNLLTRASESRREQNPQIPVVAEVFKRLADELEALADTIASGKDDVYGILERINAASYICTGNGYYLFQKGAMAFRYIDDPDTFWGKILGKKDLAFICDTVVEEQVQEYFYRKITLFNKFEDFEKYVDEQYGSEQEVVYYSMLVFYIGASK